KMGFPDTFIRMWEYYLCYCEGGFAERYINDVQMLFTKPMCRREPLVPSLVYEFPWKAKRQLAMALHIGNVDR
ncbi:MAG: hypothetical protein P8169_08325, partial [Chloroflexota bacterium]